ncbi:MAG: dihydrodipicolinate synthase family protein [Planctomycetes bacterium]|nr:dihydrodipicolinate synthase family protein [Planctomycetota bacterium]
MRTGFSGIIPPIITPMVSRDQLDHAGLERLIDHLLSGGVHGIFALGTTGESPSLSYSLRREMVSRTIELVRSRVPVLVGITDTSFVETVDLAKHAADRGATALVLSTPYYFPAGQTELRYYVDELLQELPLPVMLYNIPSLTKVAFEIPTLEYLSRHPKIVGLKDSGGDLGYYAQAVGLKVLRPDWSILLGPEALLAESLKLGGDGGVAGGANIFPSLFVQLYQSVRDNDPNWKYLQQRVERLQKIYDVGKYASRFIKATKCGASLLGLCDDFLADPFHRFHPEDRAKVEAILKTV